MVDDHGGVAVIRGAAGLGKSALLAAAAAYARELSEVADLVLLLASDRAANVTGADFVIDGGLITTL